MTSTYRVNVRAPSANASSPPKYPALVTAAIVGFACPVAMAAVASIAESAWGSMETDVLATPSNDHLRQLAGANPPPRLWLHGAEEDLF